MERIDKLVKSFKKKSVDLDKVKVPDKFQDPKQKENTPVQYGVERALVFLQGFIEGFAKNWKKSEYEDTVKWLEQFNDLKKFVSQFKKAISDLIGQYESVNALKGMEIRASKSAYLEGVKEADNCFDQIIILKDGQRVIKRAGKNAHLEDLIWNAMLIVDKAILILDDVEEIDDDKAYDIRGDLLSVVDNLNITLNKVKGSK